MTTSSNQHQLSNAILLHHHCTVIDTNLVSVTVKVSERWTHFIALSLTSLSCSCLSSCLRFTFAYSNEYLLAYTRNIMLRLTGYCVVISTFYMTCKGTDTTGTCPRTIHQWKSDHKIGNSSSNKLEL